MTRTWKWFSLSVVLAGFAIGAGIVISKEGPRETFAHELAAKPARERNLVVFDAACALVEKHFYDSKFSTTPTWQKLKAEWRAKAADAEPPLLYVNVLDNFARSIPESHVNFSTPPAPSQPKAAAAANPKVIPEVMYLRAMSGPGFDAPMIRRGLGHPQVVGDVVRGSPAERAGVMPGWVLMKNGISVTADGAHYTAEFLRLDPESSRSTESTGQLRLETLTTQAQLEAYVTARTTPLEFELEQLAAPAEFEVRRLPGDVTYVRFDRFETLELVGKAIDAIDSAGPAGLILDLRHNYGGRQLHLNRVAGALLGGDAVLGTQRAANSSGTLTGWRFGSHYEGPLVVLVGPTTASAAEITAAAVQDLKRGKLIGRVTNGSVMAGQWFDLPDGGRMMLPTSDFVRGDGRRIEGAGVEPDIWVLPTLEDVRAGRDPALERALVELRR